MSITVSSIRQDKLKSPGKGIKCGRGYISQGEKCKSSGSTRAKVEKAAQIGGGLIGLGSLVGSAAAYLAGKPGLAMNIGRVGTAANAVAGAGMVSEGRRTKNKKLVKEGRDVLVGSAVGAAVDFGVNTALKNVRTSGSPFKTGPKEGGGSSLYAGPKPKRDPIIGLNGFELRDKNNQYARWKRRTKEVEKLEGSFRAPNKNVESIRKLNRIYKGPSAKRDRKDSKKSPSVWAAGSIVTDGENYWDC